MGSLARYHVILILFGAIAAGLLAYAYATGGDDDTAIRTATAAATVTSVKPGEAGEIPSISAVGTTPVAAGATGEAAPAAPAPSAGRLSGRVVCIDPGHAASADLGSEPIGPGASETKVRDPGGTSGVASGTPEHVITLAIAIQLKQMLEARGATVVMTREAATYDGGNRERAQVANRAGADLFIRIHCDGSTNPSFRGVSTLYPAAITGWTDDILPGSRDAATSVQAALVTATGAPDNGTVARSDITGFNWADVPAILVEAGFLTNPEEDALLNSPQYQAQVAAGLAQGIEAHLASG